MHDCQAAARPSLSQRCSLSLSGWLTQVTPDPASREPGSNWQRKQASWIGASMFASLDTFNQVRPAARGLSGWWSWQSLTVMAAACGQVMVTNQEWEDVHEPIIHRKCI